VAKWSLLLHIWHPPNTMEKDDASRLCTVPLNKLISVLFNAVTCFSIMVSEVPSFCSSFRGSKGVFPSSPNNLSNFVAASTNYSIFITILTTHNFRIYGLNLAKNLFFLLSVLYPAPLKQFMETFKVFLNSLFRFLFDGIKLHPDVINIYVPILLYYLSP
jgi:hypothetical protein